ncbi:MAG: hypothetical protein BGO31_01995 [Bacteroidetes bacterium 43-16]|nr:MAG: hypothetical protein BGO31_01995 [Bacteroidetes bacterium 43-16]
MIQRIQSIWLLLAAIIMSALFYTSVYSVAVPSAADMPAKMVYDYTSVVSIKNNFLALGLAAASTGLSLVTIFLFKKRKQQISLTWLNILFCIALVFWLYMGLNKFWSNYPENGGNISVGLFLPVLTVFFLLLALRGIRKDEKLIKSLDRLR